MIGFAVLVGLLVTLHRNGALASAFTAAGRAATYASIEAALGGPSLDTPRGVEALVAKTPEPGPSGH